MTWISRPDLAAAIRSALREPGPAVVALLGPPDSGKTAILRAVLTGLRAEGAARDATAITGSPGPGARHRRAFDLAGSARADPGASGPASGPSGSRGDERGGDDPGGDEAGSWTDSFDALLRELDHHRRPRLLILDRLPALLAASPELGPALGHLWSGARARGLPLHLVLVSSSDPALEALVADGGPLGGSRPHTIRVEPLSVGELRDHLPRWSARDRLLLQSCLGHSPAVLGQVDPDLRPATNLQRLVLDPAGPLHERPVRLLREQFQKPERYVGVLAALAGGAREWGEIHRANPVFASGNQLAPYLATLHDLGWIGIDRSLDASPRTRRRRYHLADPFSGFWFHVVEPLLGDLLAGASPAQVWRSRGREATAAYAGSVFPWACRQALRQRGADVFRVGARTTGALWGDGYDLPVAATLRNGAALYGHCVWGRPATAADADAVHRAMRATRYGFGRQARLRVVFAADGCTEALVRRAARDELLTLVEIDELF